MTGPFQNASLRPAVQDIKTERERAIETMRNAPEVNTKIEALDALDRLALNASGWLSDSVLDKLTDARKYIITERWSDSLLALDETRASMSAFIRVLKADGSEEPAKQDALRRANDELNQCAKVLAWLDNRPEA